MSIFFAIGTNDLTMYTMAADRGLPVGSKLYDALEPAVLGLIKHTAEAAGRGWHSGIVMRRIGEPAAGDSAAAGAGRAAIFHARECGAAGKASGARGEPGAMRGGSEGSTASRKCRCRARGDAGGGDGFLTDC